MKGRKNRFGRFLIWFVFCILLGLILYLSFQNGEESKQMGAELMEKLVFKAERYIRIDKDIYLMRQMGRGLLFFLLGVVTTAAVNLTFPRWNRLFKVILITFFLGGVSYFTEKMKLYISSRHYAPEEMMISFIASMAGFLITAVMIIFFRLLLEIRKK